MLTTDVLNYTPKYSGGHLANYPDLSDHYPTRVLQMKLYDAEADIATLQWNARAANSYIDKLEAENQSLKEELAKYKPTPLSIIESCPVHLTEIDNRISLSARDLYRYLGFDETHWVRWYQQNIIKNRFAIENEDYTKLSEIAGSNGGRPSMDFAITLDFAKRIAMMARTAKGEDIRRYFIRCEEAAKQIKLSA